MAKPRGRPRKYSRYDALVAGLPDEMSKRPRYVNGIGVFRGARGETAWLKIHLPRGGVLKGKSYAPGKSVEIKLGRLSSWDWAQLEAEQQALQGRADRGEPLQIDQSPTFAAWAADWLARAKVRLKSYETVRIHLRSHLLPTFGSLSLADIRLTRVNHWIAGRLDVAKPSTVKRELSTLNAVLNDAVRHGLISANPATHADKIGGVVGRQRFLDGEEMNRLLSASSELSGWFHDFVLWALHSGMRKSEILELTWGNVRRVEADRTVVLVPHGKADQPRIVPCNVTMVEILEHQRQRMKTGGEFVFPVSKMILRRKWESARVAAKIEDATMHDLRRTHITLAAASGADLATLAARVGHTNLSMMQKHYAQVIDGVATDIATNFDAAMESTLRKAKQNSLVAKKRVARRS